MEKLAALTSSNIYKSVPTVGLAPTSVNVDTVRAVMKKASTVAIAYDFQNWKLLKHSFLSPI